MKKINAYINIKEAADFLGVSQNTLRNWEKSKSNKLKVCRHPVNKYRLYEKESLEQLLNEIKQK